MIPKVGIPIQKSKFISTTSKNLLHSFPTVKIWFQPMKESFHLIIFHNNMKWLNMKVRIEKIKLMVVCVDFVKKSLN